MTPAACGSALLRAILEAPDDDLARLAYADWLEEGGEAERAELVRLQVALSAEGHEPTLCKTTGACAACFRAIGRSEESYRLLSRWCQDWSPWGPGGITGVARHVESGGDTVCVHYGKGRERLLGFRRGFVCSVALPCAAFLAHALALFAAHPITEVRLTDRRPENDTYWHKSGGAGPDRAALLLPELFDRLPGVVRFHGEDSRAVCYLKKGEGEAALSRACVTWARAPHDLPPLEENGR